MSIVLQEFVRIAQDGRPKPLQPIVTGGYEIIAVPAAKANSSSACRTCRLSSLSRPSLMALRSAIIIPAHPWPGPALLRAGHEDGLAARHRHQPDHLHHLHHGRGACRRRRPDVLSLYGVTDFYVGFLAGIKAFTAAVLGGIGSIPGGMFGGLIIGLIEVFWSAYFSIEYKDVAAFAMLRQFLSSCRRIFSANQKSKRSELS